MRSALTVFAVVIGAASVTIMVALVSSAKDYFVSQFEATGQLQQVIVTQQTNLDYQSAQNGGGGAPEHHRRRAGARATPGIRHQL